MKEANQYSENLSLITLVLITTFFVGLLKNKYIMAKFCRNNLERISEIKSPKIYQFFSPSFFIALLLMIIVGIALSKLAIGSYSFMIAIGGLDLSLSVALLSSSVIYAKEQV